MTTACPSCATPWPGDGAGASAGPAPPPLPDDDHGVAACPACGFVLDDRPLAAGAAATRDVDGDGVRRGGVFVAGESDGTGAGEREWVNACWREVAALPALALRALPRAVALNDAREARCACVGRQLAAFFSLSPLPFNTQPPPPASRATRPSPRAAWRPAQRRCVAEWVLSMQTMACFKKYNLISNPFSPLIRPPAPPPPSAPWPAPCPCPPTSSKTRCPCWPKPARPTCRAPPRRTRCLGQPPFY
jgi:hypothetical protein